MREPTKFLKVRSYFIKEYSFGKDLDEAMKIIRFADFIRFDHLYDAITAAVACFFFVSENE